MGVQPVTPVGVTLDPTANQPPTASFTVTPNPAQTGQTVTFNGSASTDPDGTIAKYEWDLDGNGTYETNTGTTPTATHDLREHRRRHGRPARHRQRRASAARPTAPSSIGNSGNGSYAVARRSAPPACVHYWRMGETSGTTLRRRRRQQPRDRRGGADARRSPARSPNDRDTAAASTGSTTPPAPPSTSRAPRSHRRVLDEVERLRQRRRPGDGVHPELQLNRGGFLIDPNAPQQGGSSASRIGSGARATTSYFTRPSAGVWHHYAFVLDTTAPAATQITPTSTASPSPTRRPHGTGAGTSPTRRSTSCRAARVPVRRRRPRRGGDLQPGADAATIAHHFSRQRQQTPTASFTLAQPGRRPARP